MPHPTQKQTNKQKKQNKQQQQQQKKKNKKKQKKKQSAYMFYGSKIGWFEEQCRMLIELFVLEQFDLALHCLLRFDQVSVNAIK